MKKIFLPLVLVSVFSINAMDNVPRNGGELVEHLVEMVSTHQGGTLVGSSVAQVAYYSQQNALVAINFRPVQAKVLATVLVKDLTSGQFYQAAVFTYMKKHSTYFPCAQPVIRNGLLMAIDRFERDMVQVAKEYDRSVAAQSDLMEQ